MRGRDQRRHAEETVSGRTEAELDRDRLLYCPHFARLADVTQVRTMDGEHLVHNRLTHSLKVGQLARRITERLIREQRKLARRLKLNPDVAEAAGLSHDLGHPPFGHIAEHQLNELVGEKLDGQGYEGNAQSFRIVNKLAISDTSVNEATGRVGLNLTRATLNAILKYPWLHGGNDKKTNKWGAYTTEQDCFDWTRKGQKAQQRSPEAEIMDWADDITYALHDLVDFYCAGLIPIHSLADREQNSGLQQREWDQFFDSTCDRSTKINSARKAHEEALEEALSIFPINSQYVGSQKQAKDLWNFTSLLIARFIGAFELIDPESNGGECARIDNGIRRQTDILQELTWHYVIKRSDLVTVQHGQRRIVTELFNIYLDAVAKKEWEMFPIGVAEIIRDENKNGTPPARSVADYISGLTERQAIHLYKRLVGTY
jgi:dGTPase